MEMPGPGAVAGRSPSSASTVLSRFLRTPKGTLLPVLLGLAAIAAVDAHRHTLPTLAAGVAGAVAVDLVAMPLRKGRISFPSGAILTGLIVALVLSRESPVYVPLVVSAIGVASKHLLRTRWGNIFNPATLGILLYTLLARTAQTWWGALPLAGVSGFVLVLIAGWYIASKVNKLPLAASYLLAALGVCTVAAFAGDAAATAQVFRAPDINALVFFACFMLTDPPTSPAKPRDQAWFGALVGLIGGIVFLVSGVQWFILAGLPVGNAAESVRRVLAARRVRRPVTPAPVPAPVPPATVAPAVPPARPPVAAPAPVAPPPARAGTPAPRLTSMPADRADDRQVWKAGPRSGHGGWRERTRQGDAGSG